MNSQYKIPLYVKAVSALLILLSLFLPCCENESFVQIFMGHMNKNNKLAEIIFITASAFPILSIAIQSVSHKYIRVFLSYLDTTVIFFPLFFSMLLIYIFSYSDDERIGVGLYIWFIGAIVYFIASFTEWANSTFIKIRLISIAIILPVYYYYWF